MGTTRKTSRMKSIIACVWSVSIVSWCRQYLILFILLFSYPLMKVKLHISSCLYLYISFFSLTPISCILVFFLSFRFYSSSPSSFYSPSFYPSYHCSSLLPCSASSSSSSSRESTSSPSFLFFFFHFIGWSRNWYIRYPQLRSTSNSSSSYSSWEYPSLCLVFFNFLLPSWQVIMWVISSVRNICLNKASLPGHFSHSSSSDGVITWMSGGFPRISWSESKLSTGKALDRVGKSEGRSASRAYIALIGGVLCRICKWKHLLWGLTTTFPSPSSIEYFTP